MRKTVFAVAAAALALAACGGGSGTSTTSAAPDADASAPAVVASESEETEDSAAGDGKGEPTVGTGPVEDDGTGEVVIDVPWGPFDEPLVMASYTPDSTVTISMPEVYEPGADALPKYEAGAVGVDTLPAALTEGLTPVRATITYSGSASDWEAVTANYYATSGGQLALMMYDPANNIMDEPPVDRIEAGKSVTFDVGWWVEDPEDITVFTRPVSAIDFIFTTHNPEPQRPGVGDENVEMYTSDLTLVEGSYGEPVTLPNGLVLSAAEPTPYTSPNPELVASDGFELLLIEVEVENRSNVLDDESSWMLSSPLVDDLPANWFVDMDGGVIGHVGAILPGQTAVHRIIAEVPAGSDVAVGGWDYEYGIELIIN